MKYFFLQHDASLNEWYVINSLKVCQKLTLTWEKPIIPYTFLSAHNSLIERGPKDTFLLVLKHTVLQPLVDQSLGNLLDE